MKKIFLSIMIALAIFPSLTHSEQLPPCTVLLEPKVNIQGNVRGVALIFNIKRKFSDKRTSLSIHALHMPNPSRFGKYDSYEVLALKPNEISWIFPLTRYANNN
ncbi:hypothetical protein [Bacillus infantis]|uniref:hypothetical protein n=1 Tax=Bacillus infantis TaxID=324767 RepID=UPI003CF9184A